MSGIGLEFLSKVLDSNLMDDNNVIEMRDSIKDEQFFLSIKK